jgi:hypothetical protein
MASAGFRTAIDFALRVLLRIALEASPIADAAIGFVASNVFCLAPFRLPCMQAAVRIARINRNIAASGLRQDRGGGGSQREHSKADSFGEDCFHRDFLEQRRSLVGSHDDSLRGGGLKKIARELL